MAIVFTLSLILATGTYYFIEVPFRKMDISRYKLRYITASITASAAFSLLTLLSIYIQNAPFSKQTVYLESVLTTKENDFRSGSCFLSNSFNDITFFDKKLCLANKENAYNILLIGDSHAAHWYSALAANLPTNYTLSQVTSSGCKTVLPLQGEDRCTKLLQWALSEAIPIGQFNEILMASRWKLNDIPNVKPFIEKIEPFTSRVTVMGPVVEYKYSLPWLMAKFPEKDIKYFSNFNRQTEVNEKLEKVVDSTNARFYPVIDKMCSARDNCTHYVEGTPIQFDYGHLTQKGAEILLMDIWD